MLCTRQMALRQIILWLVRYVYGAAAQMIICGIAQCKYFMLTKKETVCLHQQSAWVRQNGCY